MVDKSDQELNPEIYLVLEQWLQQHAMDAVPDVPLLAAWVEGRLNEAETAQVELFLAKNNDWRSALFALRKEKQSELAEIERGRALVKARPEFAALLSEIIKTWIGQMRPLQAAGIAACLVVAIVSGFQMGTQIGTQATIKENDHLTRVAFGNAMFNRIED